MMKKNRSIKAEDEFWEQIKKYGESSRPPLNRTQVIEKAVPQLHLLRFRQPHQFHP